MKLSAEEKRKKRLHELAQKLEADGDSSLVRVLGWASLRWGSKSERVREHLQDLERVRVGTDAFLKGRARINRAPDTRPPENAGLIEIFEKEDEIRWVGKSR